jgi:hypothetical protein
VTLLMIDPPSARLITEPESASIISMIVEAGFRTARLDVPIVTFCSSSNGPKVPESFSM